MKITLLLLPLFIALCAAVSKNHLRKSFLQESSSVKYTTPANVLATIRATVNSEVNQRITCR